MTPGQLRALKELQRLCAADPDGFEIIEDPQLIKGNLWVRISLLLGPMEAREGGLDLREREEFFLTLSPDFPFEYPKLMVEHTRFDSFPHIIWSHWICLYQSKIEWNPSDGLFGFFDRLKTWIGKAAINDMDPLDGPLEPPHHVTSTSQVPYVIRCNAPVNPGEEWFGLAVLEEYPNRIELVNWIDPMQEWPEGIRAAFAIILPKPLPMEFPEKGEAFFRELLKQEFDRYRVLRYLALASLFTPQGKPIHLVLGIPMRRAADGSTRLHIAVWTTDSDLSECLRIVLPQGTDTKEIFNIRMELADKLYDLFKDRQIVWCKVLEDRNEIIIQRDTGSLMKWFTKKKVLILGCGALGSWAAEIIARTNPSLIHLVDNTIVKPGLLTRQNYRLDDIGSNKAAALAVRLSSLTSSTSINHFDQEAHKFVTEDIDRLRSYDAVIDCTASFIFQMKLERDWSIFDYNTPNIISMIIDAKAQRCLSVIIGNNSRGGPWDSYVHFKQMLCFGGSDTDIISAFYSERAVKDLFQPEPGCSDPTFSGSTADIFGLVSTALNLSVSKLMSGDLPGGIAFSAHSQEYSGSCGVYNLPKFHEIKVGEYRVRINEDVFGKARTYVQKNNRKRSPKHETGGLLWGFWDDSVGIIWILDLSGPPSDSSHESGHFICGIKGTVKEHMHRIEKSYGVCGFIGFWHTHPEMTSLQSIIDLGGMAELVSHIGNNQRRSIMLIFGRDVGNPSASINIFESNFSSQPNELISVGINQFILDTKVV